MVKLFVWLYKLVYEASALYKRHRIDFKEFMNYALSAGVIKKKVHGVDCIQGTDYTI